MIDQLTAKIIPAKLEAERVDIEGRLAGLCTEREDYRITAGQLFYSRAEGSRSFVERQITEHHQRIAGIDAEMRELRARRRRIMELLRPEPAAQKRLVDVPMSADLVSTINELAAARDDRQRLIAERAEDETEADQRKRADKIAQIEDRIRDLRVSRAKLMEPYNAKVAAGLSPMVRSAALRLDSAAQDFNAALAELLEIAAVMPAAGVGMGTGLEPVAAINTQPVHAARQLATILIAANPEVSQ